MLRLRVRNGPAGVEDRCSEGSGHKGQECEGKAKGYGQYDNEGEDGASWEEVQSIEGRGKEQGKYCGIDI